MVRTIPLAFSVSFESILKRLDKIAAFCTSERVIVGGKIKER
jgi:hypothetical protein